MRCVQLKVADDVEDIIHRISMTVRRERRAEVAKAVFELATMIWSSAKPPTADEACFFWIPRRDDEHTDTFDHASGRDGQC
jgi:hypothetical protein